MVKIIRVLLIVSSIIVLIGCTTTSPQPTETKWEFDDSINYTGQYKHIAEDSYQTNYPALSVSKTAEI